MNRARNADHAARTCGRFVCLIVMTTRFSDYKTWQTTFEKFTRCAMLCGLFFLDCAFRTLIGWTDKLRSSDRKQWQASVTHTWLMSNLPRILHRILPHCFFVFLSGAVKSMMLVTGSSSSQEIVLFRPQFTPFLTHDVDALDAVCTFALTTTKQQHESCC